MHIIHEKMLYGSDSLDVLKVTGSGHWLRLSFFFKSPLKTSVAWISFSLGGRRWGSQQCCYSDLIWVDLERGAFGLL